MEPASEEYRYICTRKEAKKFYGNMLESPSMLQQRWTVSDNKKQRRPPTRDVQQEEKIMHSTTLRYGPPKTTKKGKKIAFDSSNLEFLKEESKVNVNLKPDKNGSITIPHDAVTPFTNLIQIVAVDSDNTCLRNVILQDLKQQKYRDVRLTNGLDPKDR
eukprot:UN25453